MFIQRKDYCTFNNDEYCISTVNLVKTIYYTGITPYETMIFKGKDYSSPYYQIRFKNLENSLDNHNLLVQRFKDNTIGELLQKEE